MKQKLFMASSLAALMAFSASCGDEIMGTEAPPPPEGLETAQGDTNFVRLTGDEMTILRTMSGQSPKISQDEAISIAGKLLGRDSSLSKSAGAVRCEVLTRPSSKISKSGTPEQDTMMYVLNYGNSGGYAVVCADVRVPDQVFAYSDTGEMDTQTDNPGVQMFMDMTQDYMDLKIAEVESKRDSLESVLQDKLEEASCEQGKHLSKSRTLISSYSYDYWHGYYTTITDSKSPMLRTYWDQESPYNDYVPECSDSAHCKYHNKDCHNEAPAGCTAVAEGQLIAHWKYPAIVNGVAMNWNSMRFASLAEEKWARQYQNYKHRVATLMKWIGENIDMKYGCGGSGAWPETAVSHLKSLGYYTSDMTGYNANSIAISLRNTFPVMIYGYENYDTKNGYTSGHTWLIDGYVKETTYHQTKTMLVYTYRESNGTTSTEVYYTWSLGGQTGTDYYFHCNWGWGNDLDGFYLSNVFNTAYQYREVKREVYQEDYSGRYMEEDDNSHSSGYFKYAFKVALNIHR